MKTEQEPVAWGVYDPNEDMLVTIYGYKERPNMELKERFEWVKLYTSPPKREQEPVAWMQDSIELYVREEKDIVRGYVIPLYTAPPKREPFGRPEERQRLSKAYSTRAEQVAFEEGIIFAKILYGIGGE